MANGVNKVILLGNLGADGELRVMLTGRPVLNFRIATSESWKDKDGKQQEKTEWHRCALFGPRAEALAPFLKKGTKLYVEGSLKTTSYEKGDQTHYSTDVVVREVEFAGGGSGPRVSKDEAVADTGPEVDDIPFGGPDDAPPAATTSKKGGKKEKAA